MSKRFYIKFCKLFFANGAFVLIALFGSNNINAQLSKTDIIKVQAKGSGTSGQAATGFLWQNSSQVVTSLHAVLHSRVQGGTIEVSCNGDWTTARVEKVLKKADLVLLKTTEPIDGCTVFKDKFPKCEKPDNVKPNPGTELFAAGFKGIATTATERNLVKAKALGPETLEGLVSEQKTKDAIEKLQFPKMNLDIYLVKGDGLGGGYSGGPVVDKDRKLLAVVDGGMDKGATDYNWLVPAKYLNCLLDSQVKVLPKVDLALLDAHFSAGLLVPTEIIYTPQTGQQTGSKYHFVKTKTKRLDDIVNTADPRIAESIQDILNAHEQAAGANAINELSFDFFQDTDRNLIIAVPTGQGLIDGLLKEPPYTHLLRSDDKYGDGFIEYREYVPAADGSQIVAIANDFEEFFPDQEGYFDAFIDETIRHCNKDQNQDCSVDAPTIWITKFSKENKVLTFGVYVESRGENPDYYDYYNVTVRNDTVFEAYAYIPILEGEGLFQCDSWDEGCEDKRLALLQMSQLVAANLTTFARD